MEVKRHTPLTDKMCLHFFELSKLPRDINTDDKLELWLSLFNAETEEELAKIESMEVLDMEQAIGAYRQVTATDEFKQIERMRSDARHNEAAALRHAAEVERGKWQVIVADKDAELADKDAENKTLRELLAKFQSQTEN